MTRDEKRLIIAKGIAGLFDVIDTIGFNDYDIDAYTGKAEATGDILALKDLLCKEEPGISVSGIIPLYNVDHIASVVWK